MADNAADEGTIPETQFNAHQQPPPELPNDLGEELDAKRSVSKTPESQQPQNPQKPQHGGKDEAPSTPPSPETPPHYDWDEFERRYEQALRGADEKEKDILKEADSLAQYFRAWASAASAHDDERAAKRLQTRRRFVNIREEEMGEKQKRYEEVVRAFESALALLRT